MKGALVLHGDAPSKDELALLEGCHEVVAADGAALHLFRAGLAPDLVVGDLDSLGEEGLRQAGQRGVPVRRHPPRKDATDGELALDALLEMGPTEVLILGGHGGRSALFLANLHLLRRCHDLGIPARMLGRGEELRYARKGERLALGGHAGRTLNLLAADAPGARVRLEGCAWSGEALLDPRSARGVSNRVQDASAAIEVLDGVALVVLES